MRGGHCILSHGFESGPDAAKVTALAQAAERLGWTCERPDYTDLDARRAAGPLGDLPARLARLLALARAAVADGRTLVLAGSSLGAWISAQASVQVPVRGVFLMAPPVRLGPEMELQAGPAPLSIVHGWNDALIPASDVAAWARPRRARLLLVDDDHRLSRHVDDAVQAFMTLLERR